MSRGSSRCRPSRRGEATSAASGTTIDDPLTGNANGSGRTAFANNVIPADRMSRVARHIIERLPLPTTLGDQLELLCVRRG